MMKSSGGIIMRCVRHRTTVFLSILTICVEVLFAVAANAQTAGQSQTETLSPTIVVTGKREAPVEMKDRATAFVRLTGVAAGDRAAARWEDPICPRVIGIAVAYGKIVEDRLHRIATDAGVLVARQPCRTNIAVAFTTDAAKLVRTVSARSSRQLAEVSAPRRRALLRGSAPVNWWYRTELRSKDGAPAGGDPPVWASGNSEHGGTVISADSDASMLTQYNSSIISTQGIRALKTATVIIDIDRARGVSLDAVADYAALVSLAEIGSADSPPPQSILNLFDDKAATNELTPWDTAFLRALYRLPLDRAARQQRGFIVREMVSARLDR